MTGYEITVHQARALKPLQSQKDSIDAYLKKKSKKENSEKMFYYF